MNELFNITKTSLQVSGISLVIAGGIGIPAGVIIGLSAFRGKKWLIALVNTGMGLPPVLVGLVVAMLLWRSGPLGFMGLLYSKTAMVIAQTIIALPMITAFTIAGIQKIDPGLIRQTVSLGATRLQFFRIIIQEARLTILVALMAGFGSIISEVGAVMMVGGNIRGETTVLTTGILQSTRMGLFNEALLMGGVLLAISFVVNLALTLIQQKRIN
ncbi:MAG TPA: ABC transporter permease [Planctomycetota bacterium]|nr:ABC transporter permease [Planctomycetota bacterium]